MVTRRGRFQQSHIYGAGFLAVALGAYHLASQSGLVPMISGVGSIPTTSASAPEDNTPFQLPEAQSTPVEMESGSQVLPPSGEFVSFENPLDRGLNPLEYSNAQSSNYEYPQQGQTREASMGDIQVYFSPKGGCTDAIVAELNKAQRQILIQAYSFTSEPIAAASVAAHKRGVQVSVVLDKSQETEQYSAADFLVNSGIPTVIDAQHAIAHNKVILIDGRTLITGSFNFTTNAEQSNAENLLIIRNRPDLYSAYEKNLQHHFEHSKQYVERGNSGKSSVRAAHRPK